MLFNIGDLVTRNSHGNDIIFKIIAIDNNIAYLNGIDVRLTADSNINDLKKVENPGRSDDEEVSKFLNNEINLDRNEYFYLPGKVLHIDADNSYLKRCMSLYKKLKIKAYGVTLQEEDISRNIYSYLEEIKPDIVVITGHDAYFKEKKIILNKRIIKIVIIL